MYNSTYIYNHVYIYIRGVYIYIQIYLCVCDYDISQKYEPSSSTPQHGLDLKQLKSLVFDW
jgi:hypothetical protein